jgi:HlyD family secretion protein
MRSSQANDIIEQDPPWLVRWGVFSILVLLLIMLVVSNMIAYPDINTAKVRVTTLSPPIPLFARTSGYIKEVLVSDGDTVKEGGALVVIDNSSDLKQMEILKDWLDDCRFDTMTQIVKSDIPSLKQLGELQQLYNDLLLLYNNARLYSESVVYDKKISQVKADLSNYRKLLAVEEDKYDVIMQEFSLLKNEVDINDGLFVKGVISRSIMNQNKRTLLQKKMEVEKIRSNIINIKINVGSASQQILELENAKAERMTDILLKFNNKIKELKVAYQNWEDKYILDAKIDGRVALFTQLEPGEFITSSEHILTLLPMKKQQIYATGVLPITNSGKVKIGQNVNVKLDDYPYREFGMLKGRLVYISQTQSDGFYSVKIEVTGGLSVNDKRKFDWFKSNMLGSAEIITDNLSLFQRFLFRFRQFERNKSSDE